MNKVLKGGNHNDPFQQIKTYMSMIILGYFGVKIVYGLFFKFYPLKYYYRNVDINVSGPETQNNQNNSEQVLLNAYMPGIWNTEITDFSVTVILAFIVYIYTNLGVRAMIDEEGNLSSALLLGYILGLGYPPYAAILGPILKPSPNNNMGNMVLNCLSIGIFVLIIVLVILSNYFNAGNMSNVMSYSTFCAAIVLLLFGLFIARKQQETVGPVTYYFSNAENCKSKSQKYVMSSGDLIKISPAFACFVLLLFFSYDPSDAGWKYVYIMFFGIILGVFVSAISYYGIEYFLIKQPIKQCNSASECSTILDPESYDEEMSNELEQVNTNKKGVNIIKVIMIIALIAIVSFLIYKNVSK